MQPDFEIEDALSLTTGAFLRLMFGRCKSGFVEIAYIAPEGLQLYPRVVTAFRPLPVAQIAAYPPAILNKNAQGYGAYFGTTVSGVAHPPEQRVTEHGREYTFYPRRKKADVTHAPALWVDVDGVTPEEGYNRVIRAPVPPSIVVRSGGGLHAYWLLNQPVRINQDTREIFEATLRALAKATGGDEQTCEVARVMRLPGTVNTKPGRDGALCEVLDCIPVYYDYEMLRYELRSFLPREQPRTQRSVPMGAVDPSMPRYVTDFLQYGAPAGKRNHTLFVCASFYRDHGKSQMEAENDLAPVVTSGDFSHEEAMRTISSAYSESAKPVLPRHMAARMAMGDRQRN
jgi:hypothetical protein